MDTLSPENKAATKVIAKACTWADRRQAVRVASPAEKRIAEGRYKVSRIELAEAVELYRAKVEKAGK